MGMMKVLTDLKGGVHRTLSVYQIGLSWPVLFIPRHTSNKDEKY